MKTTSINSPGFIIAFGILYPIGYLFLNIGAIGGGHGTFIFLPTLLTLVFPLLALVLTAWADRLWARIVVLLLMILHYVIGLGATYIMEAADHFQHTLNSLQMYGIMFTLTALWYLLGQFGVWMIVFARASAKREGLP